MNNKIKLYLKMNIVTLFFIVISFISATLAWFAYSGIARTSMEVVIKSWYIELTRADQQISNEVVIPLSDIHPGMETVHEVINIKNKGDSDAKVNYKIVSARILDNPEDNYVIDETNVTSDNVEDILSHKYPFKININLSKNYVLSKGEDVTFEVSVSWPLDSGDDLLDSSWGKKAYDFMDNELERHNNDNSYQVRPYIQIVIDLKAEQYMGDDTDSDMNYDLGDVILYDVVENKRCSAINYTCLPTNVIDVNNKNGDNSVTLLLSPKINYYKMVEGQAVEIDTLVNYDDYDLKFTELTSSWTAPVRKLNVDDILKVISTDILNSYFVGNGISNSIIGNLKYNNRMNLEIEKATSKNGYYTFLNQKFSYLVTTNCYWTKTPYDDNHAFAVVKIDENNSKIYNEERISSCNVVPVIDALKENLILE